MIDEKLVMINGKAFKRRQRYLNGYYYECGNTRKNEHIRGQREFNCSARVFIISPLLQMGTASLVKDHIIECKGERGKEETKDKSQNSKNPQESPLPLKELVKTIIVQDPAIRNSQIVSTLKEQDPERFGKLAGEDVKHITIKVKKEMEYNTIFYALKNPNTVDNTIFLRSHGFSYVLKGQEIKKLQYLIWVSNSQMLRAINAPHYYIDGTFDVVPHDFAQMLVVMTNDPITDHPKPLAYLLLSSKDEEIYTDSLKSLLDILTNYNTRKINLRSITLDFECAMMNAVRKTFPETKIIGCLFHLKNALWRWARANKLGNDKVIHVTSSVIDKMVALCWQPEELEDVIQSLQDKHQNNQEILDFIAYFAKNYKDYFQNGVLDYTDINQHHRANSCLESYHNHLQKAIPRNPSWYELVDGLKKEEYRIFSDQLKKERNGEMFVSSTSFGTKFTPAWALNRLRRRSLSSTPRENDEDEGAKSNRQKGVPSRSKSSINLRSTLEKKKNNGKTKSKFSRNQGMKKVKKNLAGKSNESQSLFQSFKNEHNSCRYDAFVSFYYYSLYNSYEPCFNFDQLVIPSEIMFLYLTCEEISNGGSMEDARDGYWRSLFMRGVDRNPVGVTGFVTDLFGIFNHVTDFWLYFEEEGCCKACNYTHNKTFRSTTPWVSIPTQLREDTFHHSYINILKEACFNCPRCSNKTYFIRKKNIQEPKFLVILDDNLNSGVSPLKLKWNWRNFVTGKILNHYINKIFLL